MKTTFLGLALGFALLASAAHAQSGEQLLTAKGCLGCHGVDQKKMGPALKEAAAKYKGDEAKIIANLREGKGHPMKVDASEAELKSILAFLTGSASAAAKPAPAKEDAKPAPAAGANGEQLVNAKGCLGCHGITEKKMGPALREAAAKYKGSEGKVIANLREGKGHPVKVDASEGELRSILAFAAGSPPASTKVTPPAKEAAKPAPAAPSAGEELLTTKGCLGCHGINEKKVGPALKDAAAKYKGAEAKIIANLREGKGHPVKVDASEAELRAVFAYLSAGGAAGKAARPQAGKSVVPPVPAVGPLDKSVCLGCHGNEGFSMPGPDGKPRALSLMRERFEHSVHGKRQCVECHKDITEIPHAPGVDHKVSCVTCHDDLWKAAQREGKTKENERLGVVVSQIDRYMKSVHARPSREDQSRTNATCYDCHNAHYVYPLGTQERADFRLNIPRTCGKCHAVQLVDYTFSVHGQEVLRNRNAAAAVCSDCHTTHDVERPASESAKLAITKNCGTCHAESFRTYSQTYHGQVNRLGYGYTAKCFDCHGGHTVVRASDPASSVHRDNRLNTCRKCHQNATGGFVTFEPHANSHDFARYPQVWLATKFMVALLIGVFVFFWTHSALWFYREWQDRKARKPAPHVTGVDLHHPHAKQFQRFGPHWRLAHLLFAISVMTLVLTGMAVFFGDSVWAKVVVALFGSPKVTAIVHRTAATVMLGIFFIHLVALAIRTDWRKFDWFGPLSLVPTWQDGKDILAMFSWFFGQRPRPQFDRWTYWEKFDYWAVFWGMAIIGGSGMMLAFPEATASVLPGWIFNVATIVHGEEAILATVFLFTVHFLNNHFRPDKFPLDTVMFTGAVPLEEFKREHALEYERLKKSGELEKHLVDAPSRPMTIGSTVLGFILISFGLMLLVMVVTGFLGQR